MSQLHFSSYIVQRVTEETPGVRSYGFTFGISPFSFEAGQFVVVRLNPQGLEGSITLSSSPLRRDGFEITVKRLGTFGTAFFTSVGVGSVVAVGRPMGHFHLERADPRPLCFIGRDYAITAARAMFQAAREARTGRPLTLLHEISEPAQALYHREFCGPAYATVARYLFLESGRIDWPTVYLDSISGNNLSTILPNLRQHVFYIAGEGVDVKRYRRIVEGLGVGPSEIRAEKWSA